MIRLSGPDRAFRHDGLILEANWSSFERLTEQQRATLRDFHGRHVRVHPNDYGELAKLGLRMQTDDAGNPSTQTPLLELEQFALGDKTDADKTDNPKTLGDKTDVKPAKASRVDAKKEG